MGMCLVSVVVTQSFDAWGTGKERADDEFDSLTRARDWITA